jgi:hypothetical protein
MGNNPSQETEEIEKTEDQKLEEIQENQETEAQETENETVVEIINEIGWNERTTAGKTEAKNLLAQLQQETQEAFADNDWKAHAKKFLFASFSEPHLLEFYKSIVRNKKEIEGDKVIDAILSKFRNPFDLLKKQQITMAIIKRYLGQLGRDTKYLEELKAILIQQWSEPFAQPNIAEEDPLTQSPAPGLVAAEPSSAPIKNEKKRPIVPPSSTTSTKKPKGELRIPLSNWWKVTNCVTDNATCSGFTESGFVVSPPFPNQELEPSSEIPGKGNVIYVLGQHSEDADQVEDSFGLWPTKMSGSNAPHFQFRSLLSESISEFSTRYGMKVDGTSSDHSSFMLLFSALKLLNAMEVRKMIKKEVKKSLKDCAGLDLTPFPQEIIDRLVNEFHVPLELITALDRVEQHKDQLDAACLVVHEILHLKDKKRILNVAMNQQQQQEGGLNLPKKIYRNRLQSLDACEKRAAKRSEEEKDEKKELKAAIQKGLEAQSQVQREQYRGQLAALELSIAARDRTISRLQGSLFSFSICSLLSSSSLPLP